jgi:hypothetical protein
MISWTMKKEDTSSELAETISLGKKATNGEKYMLFFIY